MNQKTELVKSYNESEKELNILLNREDLKVKNKYDDKDKRLYLSGIDGFTVYLQEIENSIIFVRVWKAWNKDNPKNKQEMNRIYVILTTQ